METTNNANVTHDCESVTPTNRYDLSPFHKLLTNTLDLEELKQGLNELRFYYLEMSLLAEQDRKLTVYSHENAINHSFYLSEIVKCLEKIIPSQPDTNS